MTTPTSTYRLQLHPGFTLDDALEVDPYLHDLGVGALYLSPVMEATPGSTHGYDVTDPTRVRAELGGPDALRRLPRRPASGAWAWSWTSSRTT